MQMLLADCCFNITHESFSDDLDDAYAANTGMLAVVVDIEVAQVGTLWKSVIKAPEVQEKFKMNISTKGVAFLESTVIGPYLAFYTPVQIHVSERPSFPECHFEGRFCIRGNGQFVESTFNAKTAGIFPCNLCLYFGWFLYTFLYRFCEYHVG